jgi:hypothetical protein
MSEMFLVSLPAPEPEGREIGLSIIRCEYEDVAKELGWFWTETKSVVGADGLRCHLLLVRRLPDGKPEVWELKMQPIATKLEDAE